MEPPATVAWQPWSEATFEAARRRGTPILVNVAAAWCHWCHVMDQETFADAKVAGILKGFTAIRVDADARPDLAERYADWGWPANALLSPDGRPVTELRGYQEAVPFGLLLSEIAAAQQAGTLQPRAVAPAPKRLDPDLGAIRDRLSERLASYYDAKQGGWGRFQKYPFPGPIEHSLLRAGRAITETERAAALRQATTTLSGTLKLIDPAWGGAYQYSVNGNWDEPHFEKIAAVQAAVLESMTLAWQSTRDPRWRKAANDVQRYLLRFLRGPDGGFWTSQDADAQRPDGRTMAGAQYYDLSDAGRRKVGAPRTDMNAYADWNGLLIHALCLHHDATGDVASLAAARMAARKILTSHREPNGLFRHGAAPAELLHLRDTATMGRALVALSQATGETHWLDAAAQAATGLMDALEDHEGGFFAHTPDPAATGVFLERRHPVEDNGRAIRFLVELANHLPEDDPLAERAKNAATKTARRLADPTFIEPEAQIIGQFLLGVEWLLTAPPKLILVGNPAEPRAAVLHAACLALNAPGKVVRWSRPEEYPRTPARAAYLCLGNACSRPVTEPADLASELARLRGP